MNDAWEFQKELNWKLLVHVSATEIAQSTRI